EGKGGNYAPTPYRLSTPAWAPAMPIPQRNPLTVEGVELGRALFHDTRLSGSGKVSCAGCHQPKNAFARHDPPHPGMRNTPSLLNIGWHPRLFWDGGVSDLESVSLAPLHSAAEMGGNLVDVRTLLRTDGHYRRLLRKAFGTDSAQSWQILQALAQYQRTLVTKGARVDKPDWMPTEQEALGQLLFGESCARCHTPPFYTDFAYHAVYRVPAQPLWPIRSLENGRYRITQQPADLGAYKTPSLRNAMRTAPFMHDGSLTRLEDCLGHGTVSVQALSEKYGADTNAIRAAFVKYLEALTDTVPSR
ncbi:cytochrome-c peroxidase, partial [Nostoc sp. CMAA1605]|uniref:cytochrome-c peroxidase n=1 Tax=Nostoc sp. CMAA1605 TaxID=2055159 RepID=UPI001F231FC1